MLETAANFVERCEQFVNHAGHAVGAGIDPSGLTDELVAVYPCTKKMPGPHLARNRLIRHDADAKSGLDHGLDDLDVLRIHHDRRLDLLGHEE